MWSDLWKRVRGAADTALLTAPVVRGSSYLTSWMFTDRNVPSSRPIFSVHEP